jgi:CRP-like cAMP-binding protein
VIALKKGRIMTSRLALSALTISVALVGSGAALGQESKTREQVRAELAEANRDGTILSGDGTLWRDLGAPRRPADTTLADKTREQVKAELAEANREGTILSNDGTLWRDLGTLHQPADTGLAGTTREQVRAELAKANRDGTILSGDGTLWRDLGSLHHLEAPSFFARSNHSSSTPSMAGTDRSADMGTGKN